MQALKKFWYGDKNLYEIAVDIENIWLSKTDEFSKYQIHYSDYTISEADLTLKVRFAVDQADGVLAYTDGEFQVTSASNILDDFVEGCNDLLKDTQDTSHAGVIQAIMDSAATNLERELSEEEGDWNEEMTPGEECMKPESD